MGRTTVIVQCGQFAGPEFVVPYCEALADRRLRCTEWSACQQSGHRRVAMAHRSFEADPADTRVMGVRHFGMKTMGAKQFGARVTRLEDPALLSGPGRYVDDLAPPGVLHACFVRSPLAHGRIRAIQSDTARTMPGVHAVLTAGDLPAPMRERIPTLQANPAMKLIRTERCLAGAEVCYVGQAVALVIADSRALAEDAAALVNVDYETLPVAADCRNAAKPGTAAAHADLSDNLARSLQMTFGDVDAAFARATHVCEQKFWMHRGCGVPMETRAVVAQYDRFDDRLTVWSATQTPHLGRRILAYLSVAATG